MVKMQAKSDAALLREYVEQGAELALGQVVARHTDLVFAAAWRQVGSPDLAHDVAQSVFTDLVRKAPSLVRKGKASQSLAGWLYRSTRYAAQKVLRAERRRLTHERQAMERLDCATAETSPDWKRLRPVLDEAMAKLSAQDRDALLLRFFQDQDFRSVGVALGLSDDAAQKRVTRALDKLRAYLTRRGVSTAAAALSSVLSANAVEMAPAGLAGALTSGALAGAGAESGTTIALLKLMTMTKLKFGLIGAMVAASAGSLLLVEHQSLIRLRAENGSLRQQAAQLGEQQEGLANELAQAKRSAALSSNQLSELLRLRSEVGQLRRQQRELERAGPAAQARRSGLAAPPVSGATEQPARPSPFQLQLVLDEPGENTEPMTNHAGNSAGETLYLQKGPLLDYTAIRSAIVTANPLSGAPEIAIQFSPEGQERFAQITKEHINKRLAIVMDGHLYSAPVIRSEISEGKALISGSFTEAEARELAAKINQVIGSK
ncbi:MAG: sigma-70 family RNA polymerase sigma factor [Verrucomicrobiota bacterium]